MTKRAPPHTIVTSNRNETPDRKYSQYMNTCSVYKNTF
jgi:hypothetical protein